MFRSASNDVVISVYSAEHAFAALVGGSVLLIAFSAQIRHLLHWQRFVMILKLSLSCVPVLGDGWLALS